MNSEDKGEIKMEENKEKEGKTLQEVYDNLNQIRTDMAEESNQKYKGFDEVFKQASQYLFETIKIDLNCDVENVEYANGYFIVGSGDNSVVTFHIKQAKGWRFGIWFDYPEEGKRFGGYEVFAQVEENIDKFKPSNSTWCEKERYHINEDKEYQKMGSSIYSSIKMIQFIVNEPYLAYYRDIAYVDFNEEHITRSYAKREVLKHIKSKKLKKKYANEINVKLMKLIKRYIKKHYKGFKVKFEDNGENCYPRYNTQLIAYKEVWNQYSDRQVKDLEDNICKYIKDLSTKLENKKKYNKYNVYERVSHYIDAFEE